MRNFKTKSIFLNIILAMLCFCSVLIFTTSPIKIDRVISRASCTKGPTEAKNTETANTNMYTGNDYGGNIPFSLFLCEAEGNTNYVTDYFPTFTETEPNGTDGVYKYEMDLDSRPSFLLSSSPSDEHGLYNTSIVFIFNDSAGKKNDNIIPNEVGYLSVTATLTVDGAETPIVADPFPIDSANTNESSYKFKLNLQRLINEDGSTNTNAACPKKTNDNNSETSFVGGEGVDNDVSKRTGLYKFHIEYSYREASSFTSNRCVFELSFHVLDYNTYVKNDNPFIFTNTDTVMNGDEDLNYEVYNYNYLNTPTVEFDATKFGLNFVYSVGSSNHSMEYRNDSFVYNYNQKRLDEIFAGTTPILIETADKIKKGILPTGKVIIYLKNTDDVYYEIKTYYKEADDVYGERPYMAKFDLKDFEAFLVKNKSTFHIETMQGTYHFDLDFLAPSDNKSLSIVNKGLFTGVPSKISNEKLVIFGYELKYLDQNPNNTSTYRTDVTLINDVTHTNFVAYNSTTSSANASIGLNTGCLVNIPKYMAVTDQAPLRFHSNGNLFTEGGQNYTAEYRHFDLKNYTEESILEFFKFEENVEYSIASYEAQINSQALSSTQPYTQGASISGDGIRVMKLKYAVSLPLTNEDGSYRDPFRVEGTQYVVFKIDNTVQNLYIQGYEFNAKENKSKSYDFTTYTNKDVRVNIEQKPNTFFAPVEVKYSYSSEFSKENITKSGIVNLKQVGGTTYKYTIDNKNYGYYVTSNGNDYTFADSGYYRIEIRSVVTNSPKRYSFIIDKEPFGNINVNQVKLDTETDYYIKSNTKIQADLLSGKNEFLAYDLYVTGRDEEYITGFTLGWNEKRSGASSYALVYYMEITDDTENEKASLFELNDKSGDYWLTNGLKVKELSSVIDNYENSGKVSATGDARLKYNQYFNKDGLYFFYIYDDAGNFFTRIVLIDTSSSTTRQGYWDGTGDDKKWKDTFDPVGNPQNYVNHDTTIYFGTHKAISLPDLSKQEIISIEDKSFTRAYDLSSDGNGNLIATKPKIEINFNEQILGSLKNYIKTTDRNAIIGAANAGSYLTIRNGAVHFARTSTIVDLVTEEVIDYVYDENGNKIIGNDGNPLKTTDIEKEGYINKVFANNALLDGMYKADIYTTYDPSKYYNFVNEAEYMFIVSNQNGSLTGKYICMNFDVVRGTFYGYGNGQGENTEHVLRKNSATNLNVLKFEYDIIKDETAKYYTVAELTYDYYEFILDDSNNNSASSSYPFSRTITYSGDMLPPTTDLNRNVNIVDPINIDTSGLTRAGKYIVTRTYVGGDWDIINGVPTEVGTGGKYYKDKVTGELIDLFELDTIKRKYIVYVDHNGIITSTYMVREDNKPNIREVGDNITITLSNTYEDERNFKEFFLTSTATLSLNTNKVPIKINIPLSKYFAYYESPTNNLYSKLNFSKLEITIFFRASIYSEWLRYKVDGYDNLTGYCTSSALVDAKTNPNGYLIFMKAGQYRIEINDRTGYVDIQSFGANSNNLFPTKYSYSFEISHTSPYANVYKETYNTQNKQFETSLLYDDENSNSFATNIKNENENGLHNNKITFNWNDDITPYTAKVNQVNISLSYGTSVSRNIIIDLKSYNLLDIANGSGEINLSNVQNNNYVLYLKVSFFEGISEPVIYDNIAYYRFAYELSLDISQEYVYKVTFSYISSSSTNQAYKDENGKSYAESLYSLTIDRTKPFTNINNLLSLTNEEFLKNYYTAETINNFKEENFNPYDIQKMPSAFTYTFGVNNTFSLNYNENDTLPYFFVRKYNKYDNQYISITPDMIDTVYPTAKAYYTKFTSDDDGFGFGTEYPRFAEIGLDHNEITQGNYKWYQINYGARNTSLYSLISAATNNPNPSGYYEIIERDYAGNYRTFTVYFSEFTNNTNFLTLNIDGYHEQGYSKVDNISDNNITARLMFEITELSSSLGWGKVTIKNETLDANFSEEIFFNPYDSYDEVNTRLNKLNEFFKTQFDARYSVTLSKYNSYFGTVTRYINIITNENTAKLPAPTVEEIFNATNNTTTYNLVFPAYTNKSVLYLENLTLQILANGTTNVIASYEGKNNIPERITNLEKGIYRAIYNDNYNKGNSYSYIIYVGEYYINNFNKEYEFEYNTYVYDNANDIYYSGGDIDVTYEGNIYTVWVNGINISGTSNEKPSSTLSNYNCKTFTLKSNYSYENIPANEQVGGSTTYEVVYKDITDGNIQKVFKFTIFNTLPKISLLNASGGEITSTLEESLSQVTSSLVKIDWDNIKDCPFDYLNDSDENPVTTAKLYTKNQNGEYKNYVTINKGQTISDEGYYKLQILNTKLGNYREIYFVIMFEDLPLYTVTVDNKEIKPSSMENLDFTKATTAGGEQLIYEIYYALRTVLEDEGMVDDLNSLKNHLGFKDDLMFDPSTVGICSLSDIPHFYSIKNPNVIYNSNMKLNIVEFVFKNDILQTAYIKDGDANPTPGNVGTDYWTTIYLVYNLKGPIRIEFFATTKVPLSNNLLRTNFEYLNENRNVQTAIDYDNNRGGYQLYYPQIKTGATTLSWNKLSTTTSYWYNQGNVVRVLDKYGVQQEFRDVDYYISSVNNNNISSVLTGSGTHQIKFMDIAGNTQKFIAIGSYQEVDYYTLSLIDSVIYHINYKEKDYNPIQYGVFNDELSLVIDSEYLQYYLGNAANVTVTRNGSYYSGYEYDENVYKFTESGKYVVELSGVYKDENAGSMRTTTFTFTIIDSNSARLAYEFVEVPGYEITNVTRNGEDITDNFRNADGKVLSLFLSSSSGSSGNGNYSVTLKYGKLDSDTITYYFSINDYIPTLSCNVEYGGSTKGSIIITYNPSIIYEQLGECSIRVLTYNNDSKTFYVYTTVAINENSFTDATSKSIEITRSNSYFVQVQTKNGNIISSFRVNRTEPLNTFAIIIIVIAVVAVVVLIIVIVKLRTKMKVK